MNPDDPNIIVGGFIEFRARSCGLIRSTDGGATWKILESSPEIPSQPYCLANNSNIFHAPLAWGRDNALYLTTGLTWTKPRSIADDDPAKLNGKFLPMLSVAPNGRLDAAWWDTRDDPGIRANDVYYAHSEDDGETWSKNMRISDQTIDRRFGVWGNNFDQSSPPALASTNQFALLCWDDTRFSRGEEGKVILDNPTGALGVGGGVQDIFVAAVQFEEIGAGTSKTAKIILAGVIGLLAVGLILLLAGMATRRKGSDGSPAAESVGGKVTTGVT